jgi:hypothetical protein
MGEAKRRMMVVGGDARSRHSQKTFLNETPDPQGFPSLICRCGSTIFTEVVSGAYVSAFQSLNGQTTILSRVQGWMCVLCGDIQMPDQRDKVSHDELRAEVERRQAEFWGKGTQQMFGDNLDSDAGEHSTDHSESDSDPQLQIKN